MIKIENTQVVGWEPAIRGMRNPKNSWDRMDSKVCDCYDSDSTCKGCLLENEECDHIKYGEAIIGPNDQKRMMSLAKGGPVHAKYRRMITVYVDITAPLYWWKEFDTYKIGTVANSCSTMHKIHDKELTLDDFSCEHLMDFSWNRLNDVIEHMNICRNKYLEIDNQIKDLIERGNVDTGELHRLKELRKSNWWQMIQLLPSSYNQKRTIMLNYEVLAGIYPMRRNHKLDEWRVFCDWIDSLPYSAIIVPEMYSDEELEE
jgi:hypothetical protein